MSLGAQRSSQHHETRRTKRHAGKQERSDDNPVHTDICPCLPQLEHPAKTRCTTANACMHLPCLYACIRARAKSGQARTYARESRNPPEICMHAHGQSPKGCTLAGTSPGPTRSCSPRAHVSPHSKRSPNA